MAALIKALNAKIRAHPMLDYVCSTRKLPQFLPELPSSSIRAIPMAGVREAAQG